MNTIIEEKAKAYDESIGRAKEMIKAMTNIGGVAKVDDIQYLFPELKESEDERIRMALFDIVRDVPYMETELRAHGLTVEKTLAYLEKQKEQKSVRDIMSSEEDERMISVIRLALTDVPETRFTAEGTSLSKVYAWIEKRGNLMKALQISNTHIGELIEENYYLREQLGKQKEQRDYHKLYEDIDQSGWFKKEYVDKCLGKEFEQKEPDGTWTEEDDAKVKTMCKEGDLKPSEIAWLKELKNRIVKKEQKSAEVDEYKIIKKHITEDSLSSEVNKRLTECGWYVTDEKPEEWTKLTWKDINELEEIMNEVRSDYRGGGIGQKSFGLEVLERFRYIKGDELDVKEQKPAEWSEEDKFKLEDAITGIDVGIGFYETEGKHPNLLKAIIEAKEWLKSLPKRFNLQPKQEWSEEDNSIVESILFWLKSVLNKSCYPRYEHWLKSLPERFNLQPQAKQEQKEPSDKGEISDGYHTFNELYYYRLLYNAAFFNLLPKEWVHKSKRHHDGEECFGGGWFIVMANLPTGQISNHYEIKDWDLFHIPEKETADKWDGHTPQEAAERLHKFLLEMPEQMPTEYLPKENQ